MKKSKFKDSIVLNYNPFIAFKNDPNPSQMNQVILKILEISAKVYLIDEHKECGLPFRKVDGRQIINNNFKY